MGLGEGHSQNKQNYLHLSLPCEKVPCNNKVTLEMSGIVSLVNANNKLCGYRWFQFSGVSSPYFPSFLLNFSLLL